MADLNNLIQFMIQSAVNEERRTTPQPVSQFKIERKAGTLVKAAQSRATHHREREKSYAGELETAEKTLRENGLTIDVYDSAGVSMGYAGTIASGSMPSATSQFQPRIDPALMDAVKRHKAKMLEHRTFAEGYEKNARAFACGPDVVVTLTAEDIYYYRLEA